MPCVYVLQFCEERVEKFPRVDKINQKNWSPRLLRLSPLSMYDLVHKTQWKVMFRIFIEVNVEWPHFTHRYGAGCVYIKQAVGLHVVLPQSSPNLN